MAVTTTAVTTVRMKVTDRVSGAGRGLVDWVALSTMPMGERSMTKPDESGTPAPEATKGRRAVRVAAPVLAVLAAGGILVAAQGGSFGGRIIPVEQTAVAGGQDSSGVPGVPATPDAGTGGDAPGAGTAVSVDELPGAAARGGSGGDGNSAAQGSRSDGGPSRAPDGGAPGSTDAATAPAGTSEPGTVGSDGQQAPLVPGGQTGSGGAAGQDGSGTTDETAGGNTGGTVPPATGGTTTPTDGPATPAPSPSPAPQPDDGLLTGVEGIVGGIIGGVGGLVGGIAGR